jgi:transposase
MVSNTCKGNDRKKKTLEVSQKPHGKGFIPAFKRWIVERSFASLQRNRRLMRDYEHNPNTSRSLLYFADLGFILKHISKLISC